MSQDIPRGQKWRDWIVEQLKDTDLLIFLFSGPSRNWQWCLYEIGLFTPLSDRVRRPIVCIHPPGEAPPDPIDDLQSVPCDEENLFHFLQGFFDGDYSDDSINEKLAKDKRQLRKISKQIYEEWISHDNLEDRVYYTRYITFLLPENYENEDGLLDERILINGDPLSLEIFGLTQQTGNKPWPWNKFKEYMNKAAEKCGDPVEFTKSIEEMILKSCRNEMIAPATHHIESLTSKKRYQPVVHRRDTYPDGRIRVRVLFVQIPEPEAGSRNLTAPAPPGG